MEIYGGYEVAYKVEPYPGKAEVEITTNEYRLLLIVSSTTQVAVEIPVKKTINENDDKSSDSSVVLGLLEREIDILIDAGHPIGLGHYEEIESRLKALTWRFLK